VPDNRNPYDKKVDSQGDKLHPLPWVSWTGLDPQQHQKCWYRRHRTDNA
jgi:hypothetical protein